MTADYNFFELLAQTFVLRAIVSGMFAGILLSVLGIFVVLRKMSFFSEGLAHASLSGVAIGLILSQEPIIWALVFSVFFAIAIYLLERKTNLAPDSLIGVLFTSSLALGVLLINVKAGYQPDLISFLFGNILTINNVDVWTIVILSSVITAFFIVSYNKYLYISLNEEMAKLAGINVELRRLVLYVILAISIVLGIKMLGIVLVSALLIIPVTTAKLLADSARSLLVISIIISEVIIAVGIVLSLLFNLPTGSVIILTGAALFLGALAVKKLSFKKRLI